MADASTQYLIHAEDGTEIGPLVGTKGDMTFPEPVRGWSDVLDCRHTPYTEKTLSELRHFAHHVNKLYLLVPGSLLQPVAPTMVAEEAPEPTETV